MRWERKEEIIAQETQQDGWYLLHTNEPIERCATEQVLAHYKGLLDVEEAFCELKSYLDSSSPICAWVSVTAETGTTH